MTVYQAATGTWIYFDGENKRRFITESEAVDMATKMTWATQAQQDATTLAQVADRLVNLRTVYFDRLYAAGNTGSEIIDSDVVALGITAAQLGDLVTFAEHLDNFLNNGVVATLDRDPTLNAIRTDV